MEALGDAWVGFMFLCERRKLNWFVDKPEWASAFLANDFPKIIKQATCTHRIVIFHAVLLENAFDFIEVRIKDIDIEFFAENICVANAWPLAVEINLHTIMLKLERAPSFFADIFNHFFIEIHAFFVILVSGIRLHCDMLWEMFFIHALITEAWTDIINLFVAATNQTLERKLVRNAKIEILIKRIHMSDEWICVSAARRSLENRNINLNKAVVV